MSQRVSLATLSISRSRRQSCYKLIAKNAVQSDRPLRLCVRHWQAPHRKIAASSARADISTSDIKATILVRDYSFLTLPTAFLAGFAYSTAPDTLNHSALYTSPFVISPNVDRWLQAWAELQGTSQHSRLAHS
nr:hypothetical protein CFP56_24040 [Quercus suber]